ncbi:MAG: DUF429 domain-containing protein [bacterium]
MRFVGVDLAWGDRKTTAAVVLEAKEGGGARSAAFATALGTVDEIAGFIRENVAGKDAFVGIDAPLIVPNQTGSRLCDQECTAKWRRYDAGALPANKRQCGDPSRGGQLLQQLEAEGFRHGYDTEPGRPDRVVLEVYPHPASVALLGLDRIFKYKRSAIAVNQEGLAAYQAKLCESLDRLDPTVEMKDDLIGRLRRDPNQLRGVHFERQSDLVDALMCAVTSFHFWTWGSEKWEVLGKLEEGTILAPRPEAYGLAAHT